MNLELEDKVVLVSGGARGIGEAIVRAFVAEGARVMITDLDNAATLRTELGEAVRSHQGDLTEDRSCRDAVAACTDAWGRLDVLVNNAGVNDGKSLEASPSDFRESIERNLVHVFALAHHALPHLTEARGNIVNITSKVASTGQGGTSGYAASKGGVNGLTREWAADLAPRGIRVNAIAPAEVWTPMYAAWIDSLEDGPATRAEIEAMIPLGRRFTRSDEIAAMAVFLASARSAHTTGQIIYVDGGYTHLDRKL